MKLAEVKSELILAHSRWSEELSERLKKLGRTVQVISSDERQKFLSSSEEFLKFVDTYKNHSILIDQVPYEWFEEKGWQWDVTAKNIQAFDLIRFDDKGPRVSFEFFQALHETLIQNSQGFDLKQPVCIIGHGEWVRGALGVVSRLGFRRFILVSSDSEKSKKDQAIVQKSFFGLDIKILPSEELTQVTENGPLVLNLSAGPSKVQMIQDMIYFNYMCPKGLVFDFFPQDDQNYFVEEALKADMLPLEVSEFLDNYSKIMTRV